MWYGQNFDYGLIYVMYEMIMFCNNSRLACQWVQQPARATWLSLLLYDLRVTSNTSWNCITLFLWLSYSYSCNTWWSQTCGGSVDLGVMPELMEITLVRSRWRSRCKKRLYHITLFMHVMFILLCILFCLSRDGSIIRWSLTLNIKDIVFSLSMHHRESSSFWSTSWWSGVIDSTFTYGGCKPDLHMQKY